MTEEFKTNEDKSYSPKLESKESNVLQGGISLAEKLTPPASILGQDLSRMLFDSPLQSQDGAFRPLLCGVGSMLSTSGMSPSRLKAGLLAYLALVSSKLGVPLSVQLVCDEQMDAVQLLDNCMKLAPPEGFIEFSALKREHIFTEAGKHLSGRTIVTTDPGGFVSVYRDLNSLLTRGHTLSQEIIHTKYGTRFEEMRAELPVSIVGVVVKDSGRELSHPSVIRVLLPNEQLLASRTSVTPDLWEVETARLRKTFGRLQALPVEIPFLNQLWEPIAKTGDRLGMLKLEILGKVISLCAIINNPPPLYLDELCSTLYGIQISKVKKWLIQKTQSDPKYGFDDRSSGSIIATKLDYALAWMILSGVLKVGDSMALSENQRRIFEAVKRINLGKLDTAFLKKGDEIEKCATIAGSSSYWVNRENIYEEVNKDSAAPLSLTTVYNELMSLMKIGLLGRGKPPKRSNFGYYVTKLSVDEELPMLHPSEVADGVLDGQTIEIINPVTGEMAKF